MGTTGLGIQYQETGDSPKFTIARDGAQATQEYIMDWGYLDAFFYESFPAPVISSCTYTWDTARRFPGRPWLITESVEAEPNHDGPVTTDAFGVNIFGENGAKVTIKYKTQAFEEGAQVLTHKISIGGEWLTMKGEQFRWQSDPVGQIKEDGLPVRRLLPTVEHQLTFHFVPNPPFDALVAAAGFVNGGVGLFNAPVETLLFLGCEASRAVNATGSESWNLDYKFSQRVLWGIDGADDTWKTIGWNHYLRPTTSKWERLLDKNGNPTYPLWAGGSIFAPYGCS